MGIKIKNIKGTWNTYGYFDLYKIIDQKETLIKTNFNDFSNSLFRLSITMMNDYNILRRRFIKDKHKIKIRERIDNKNNALCDFMRQNKICGDIRLHIYSFM